METVLQNYNTCNVFNIMKISLQQFPVLLWTLAIGYSHSHAWSSSHCCRHS